MVLTAPAVISTGFNKNENFVHPCNTISFLSLVVTFLQGLQLTAGPSQELWDLYPGNWRKVDILCLTQIISKKHDDLFFLGPPSLLEEPHCPWTIDLTTAADALFVYHLLLEKDFSTISLGYILVNEEGICFHTLQPLPSLPVPLSIRTVHVSICIGDCQFKLSDYHTYVQEWVRLLSSPQGHAALLEGGIIGQIANEHYVLL